MHFFSNIVSWRKHFINTVFDQEGCAVDPKYAGQFGGWGSVQAYTDPNPEITRFRDLSEH